jgi:hypothetical protein
MYPQGFATTVTVKGSGATPNTRVNADVHESAVRNTLSSRSVRPVKSQHATASQPVACIMAAMDAPRGRLSSASTAACLDLARVLWWTIGFAGFACDRPDRGFAAKKIAETRTVRRRDSVDAANRAIRRPTIGGSGIRQRHAVLFFPNANPPPFRIPRRFQILATLSLILPIILGVGHHI